MISANFEHQAARELMEEGTRRYGSERRNGAYDCGYCDANFSREDAARRHYMEEHAAGKGSDKDTRTRK